MRNLDREERAKARIQQRIADLPPEVRREIMRIVNTPWPGDKPKGKADDVPN